MVATRPAAIGVPGYSETMPCEPESARRARLLVSAALNAWGVGELDEAGRLIVSELIANSIAHTRSRAVRVVVRRPRDSVVWIGVADRSREVPERRRASRDCEGGRGLVVVGNLSRRWGYDLRNWGKIVWAEIMVPTEC
mgnify:CR=1 FL=1